MKITEHNIFLTLFGILLVLLPMFGGSSMITVVIRRLWNDEIVLLFCVVAFFYVGLFLNKIKVTDSKLIIRCIALTLFFSIAAFFASRSFEFEETLRFILVVLLIPFIDYLIREYSVQLVGYLFVAIILFQSQWGLAQFITQRDLGFYLLGESKLSSDMQGVAKFDINNCVNDCEQDHGQKLIRSYGPFRHANVFGGVMTIGLMTIALLTIRSAVNSKIQITIQGRVALLSSIFFLFLGLLVSFSRSAYLAAGIMLFIFSVIKLSSVQGMQIRKLFIAHKHFLAVLIILIVLFSPLLIARFTDSEDAAITERVAGVSWAVLLISNSLWWQGVGPGAYKNALGEYLDQHNIVYQPWQIDSVHSVPLLIVAEWGLLLSFILVLLLLMIMVKQYSKRWHWFMPFIPIMLFDHYMITQAAPMVLMMVWALLLYHFHPIGPIEHVGSEKL